MCRVNDRAPDIAELTDYDRGHFLTYARLLSAERDELDWRVAARTILGVDSEIEPAHARGCFDSHLERARWVAEAGYRQALRAANRA